GDTDQRIIDFSWDGSVPLLGVVVSKGNVLDIAGQPAGVAEPAYRTLFQQGLDLVRTSSSSPIANGTPKRVFTLVGFPIAQPNGQVRVGNLAIVSVASTLAGPSRLDVIEITDPTKPQLLRSIEIPAQHGFPQSI